MVMSAAERESEVSLIAALVEGDRWLSADGCAAFLGLFTPKGSPNRKGFMDRIACSSDFPRPLMLGRSRRWKRSHLAAWRRSNPDLSRFTRKLTPKEIAGRGSKHKRANEPTCLYRHFDSSGALLYVGISLTAADRLSRHNLESPWFQDVARIDLEWHPCRTSALRAERTAIRNEAPVYNKTGAIK